MSDGFYAVQNIPAAAGSAAELVGEALDLPGPDLLGLPGLLDLPDLPDLLGLSLPDHRGHPAVAEPEPPLPAKQLRGQTGHGRADVVFSYPLFATHHPSGCIPLKKTNSRSRSQAAR